MVIDIEVPKTREEITFEKPEKKEIRIIKEKKLTTKKEKEIKDESFNELQRTIMIHLALKSREERDKATESIVERIEQENYIYTTKDDIKSEMWIYENGIYIPQGKSFIKEFCRKLLGKAYTINLANEIISKIEADTFIEHDKFFKINYVEEIPLQNGIFNIITKKLTPFDPRKIFFNKLPEKYNPKAKCPIINKFFDDVLNNKEDKKVMFEILGYLLLKEYKYEKAFMFIGDGRNGKGKTLNLIKKFIGIENCCSVPLSQIIPSSSSVAELHNRMVNMAGDLSNTDLKDTGMFKQVTGRDLIPAKRKYLRDLFFINYAKLIFACNELPKVYDLSEGFWSRWVLFTFPYKFISEEEFNKMPDKDKINCKIRDEEIIEKITSHEEMSGLLNESLEGLDRLIKQHDFSYSKGTKEVKDAWIRQSDSFLAFCFDNIKEDINSKVSKKELRRQFSLYHRKHKIKGASDKVIKITLEDNFGVSEYQDISNGERYWDGINLLNSEKLC